MKTTTIPNLTDKNLPDLSIANLSIIPDAYNEMENDKRFTEEENEEMASNCVRIIEKSSPCNWCNGYEDMVQDRPWKEVVDAIDNLKKELGDFTCTIFFDWNGGTYSVDKDTMDCGSDVAGKIIEIIKNIRF